MEKCRWRYLASLPEVGCVAPFMPLYDEFPECNSVDQIEDLFTKYSEWVDPPHVKAECEAKCPKSCVLKLYEANMVKIMDEDKKQNVFHIYYPSGQTTVNTKTMCLFQHLFRRS